MDPDCCAQITHLILLHAPRLAYHTSAEVRKRVGAELGISEDLLACSGISEDLG